MSEAMSNKRFISVITTIVFSLILVGVSTFTNASAQLSNGFPNMGSNMPFTPISGKYSDPEAGLEITFPDGWNGTEIIHSVNMTAIELIKNATDVSWIALYITDKSIFENAGGQPMNLTNNLAFTETMKLLPVGCDITNPTKISLNGMNGIQVMEQCSGALSLKYKMVMFETNKKIVSLYLQAPSTEFEKYIADFNNTVSTLTISNTIGAPSVPEFGSLAGMIIVISIIGVVLISRKFNYRVL